MNTKQDISHILIALPKEQHRRLKTKAAALGKTMREIILEALEALDVCSLSAHQPNQETQQVLNEVIEGKNLVRATSVDDFIKRIRSV
ncbi:hypothetical protein H0X48_05905 [Candidatus Dependentiae bacterium]|nr:hypothetical protein [Candidatus Dependentiae bacterium]